MRKTQKCFPIHYSKLAILGIRSDWFPLYSHETLPHTEKDVGLRQRPLCGGESRHAFRKNWAKKKAI